ncbi:AAA family ATPase [Azospirillum sp. CT11-132]|uniref:AAA family ATPase n=1 Tax=Azospirillum sp. CT11-132 TaxID=3396317 RepID=UPI0039A543D2
MRILSFSGKKIYGHLDLSVKFGPELTFITGINGKGKTTTIRCMLALLQPHIGFLLDTEHKDLRVDFEHDGKTYYIRSERTASTISLRHSYCRDPLVIPLIKRDAFESPMRFRERWEEYVAEVENSNAKNPVREFIGSLPTPMFLGLERRDETLAMDDPRRPRLQRRIRGLVTGNLYESMNDAKELAERAYRTILAQQKGLADALRQNIVLSAFMHKMKSADETMRSLPSKSYITTLEKNYELVFRTLSSIGIDAKQIDEHVRPFFDNMIETVHRLPRTKNLDRAIANPDQNVQNAVYAWFSMRPQESRINAIIKHVESYNRKRIESFSTIQSFIDTVDSFLADSGKRIKFSAEGYMYVQINEKFRDDVSTLSSGESHVFVILAQLFFNAKNAAASVLIIDEPELSLHIRWQEIFVDALRTAKPDLQIILSTHSPSIILDRTNYCVEPKVHQ